MATAKRCMGMILVNKNSNYLSRINQSPRVQKSKSILMTVVISSSVCMVIAVINVMLQKQNIGVQMVL